MEQSVHCLEAKGKKGEKRLGEKEIKLPEETILILQTMDSMNISCL